MIPSIITLILLYDKAVIACNSLMETAGFYCLAIRIFRSLFWLKRMREAHDAVRDIQLRLYLPLRRCAGIPDAA